MNSPIFMASLASVRRKLMASFAPSMKRQLDGLKSRILVGQSASTFVLSTVSVAPKAVVAELHRSFLHLQPLAIAYRDERSTRSTRTLAWDRLRDGIRTFRCDRIERAELREGAFRLRPRADFRTTLEGVEVISP
jgi:predicted DNA-binding transcriptional regulator YafY